MLRTRSLIALAIAGFGITQAAHASKVEWSVSVGGPIQVAAPAPYYVAPAPVPAAPALPSIEPIQAQQQARIQWGVQVGLISGREFHRLQQTHNYIEQQRQWAYADGWLTQDEHVNLLSLLNGSAQQIERSLVNWHHVDRSFYPMPPALTVWSAPRHQPVHYGYQRQPVAQFYEPAPRPHHGHRPVTVATPAPVITVAPVAPIVPQPLPAHPHGPRTFGQTPATAVVPAGVRPAVINPTVAPAAVPAAQAQPVQAQPVQPRRGYGDAPFPALNTIIR